MGAPGHSACKNKAFLKTLLKIDLKSILNLLKICLLMCNVK